MIWSSYSAARDLLVLIHSYNIEILFSRSFKHSVTRIACHLEDHIRSLIVEGKGTFLTFCRIFIIVGIVGHNGNIRICVFGALFVIYEKIIEGYCYLRLPQRLQLRWMSCWRNISCQEGALVLSICYAQYIRQIFDVFCWVVHPYELGVRVFSRHF